MSHRENAAACELLVFIWCPSAGSPCACLTQSEQVQLLVRMWPALHGSLTHAHMVRANHIAHSLLQLGSNIESSTPFASLPGQECCVCSGRRRDQSHGPTGWGRRSQRSGSSRDRKQEEERLIIGEAILQCMNLALYAIRPQATSCLIALSCRNIQTTYIGSEAASTLHKGTVHLPHS